MSKYDKEYAKITKMIKSSEQSLSLLEKGQTLSNANFSTLVTNLKQSKADLGVLDEHIYSPPAHRKTNKEEQREREKSVGQSSEDLKHFFFRYFPSWINQGHFPWWKK
jgi:hypothetical protein